jgi:DNA polymerase (family X)
MDNKTIARTLNLLSQLSELHNGNPFKTKSISATALKIRKLPYPLAGKSLDELAAIEGIGKSSAAKVRELIDTGTIRELEELAEKTPVGIIDILGIKGLGPKKVQILWKELGIENTGELLYACNENRLIEAKGFGLKTQEEIRKLVEFKLSNNGRFLYAQVEEFAEALLGQLQLLFPQTLIAPAGAYRRKSEIVEGLDVLIGKPLDEQAEAAVGSLALLTIVARHAESLEAETTAGIRTYLYFCDEHRYYRELIRKTGSPAHVTELASLLPDESGPFESEEAVYRQAGLQFIEPELREGGQELALARENRLPKLIDWSDLRGTLHNHSTWSDGVNTLEEMAVFCRDELKLDYLGICDHSASAFYAKGLNAERVLLQHEEIDALNAKLAGFRIFKGIESDILFDGSLDYPEEILQRFDFVVASIHSVFKMTEEKATDRLIRAIENPYTTILGHPTGRLLLSRSGYPIDFKKVIDACAANDVVIEINGNPLRLDLDWRWHQYALGKGVMLSVNPDAHSNNGFYDMHYGLLAARKGGVAAENCLNTLSLPQITEYFNIRKKR